MIHAARVAVITSTVALCLIGSTQSASAQEMLISHYADQYVDGGYVDAYMSAIDDTTDCVHSSYEMDAWGGSPTASWSDTQYGLSAGGGLPLDQAGSYWAESHLIFMCSCAVGLLDGGGTSISWPISSQLYRHNYYRTQIGMPSTYTLDQDSQGKQCAHATLTWPSSPSPEPSWLTAEGFFYTLLGQPVACLSHCQRDKFGVATGPSGVVGAPASCG
jgi:hypothetical protein